MTYNQDRKQNKINNRWKLLHLTFNILHFQNVYTIRIVMHGPPQFLTQIEVLKEISRLHAELHVCVQAGPQGPI